MEKKLLEEKPAATKTMAKLFLLLVISIVIKTVNLAMFCLATAHAFGWTTTIADLS